ncbi:hypothetical protein [Ideonella alba]|uniref:ABC transporter substrate-binding protein n=1 Tax=Ideonella alba TaxID=2824118 RepID=A0A941BHI5_9BURK|nr:hypothetical protein [Ideonella alba]MBQ0933182.1 hypothetical protein [Ideonella alba]
MKLLVAARLTGAVVVAIWLVAYFTQYHRKEKVEISSESPTHILLLEEQHGWLDALRVRLAACQERSRFACEIRITDLHHGQFSNSIKAVGEWLSEAERRSPTVVGVTGELAAELRDYYPAIGVLFDSYHDPRRSCLVTSLENPGNKASGIYGIPEVGDRMIELIVRAYPDTKRVVVLVDDDRLGQMDCLMSIEDRRGWRSGRCLGKRNIDIAEAAQFIETTSIARAAQRLAVTLNFWQFCRKDRIAIPSAGLLPFGTAFVIPIRESFYLRRGDLTNAIGAAGVPAIYQGRVFVRSGGLLALNPKIPDAVEALTEITRQISLGRDISSIPVEQPMQSEIVLNREAARSLKKAPSSSFLRLVDEFYVRSQR